MITGIAFVVLTLFAAFAMTSPWWRNQVSAAASRRRANIAAYRGRLVEIEQELAGGSLDAATAADLRSELEARLLAEASAADVPAQSFAARWPLVLVVIALPLFAGLWYWQGGSWRVQEQLDHAPANPQQGQAMAIETMVERLSQRLQAQPEDGEGWAMLGRSYMVLQRYAESAQAYAKANALIQPPQADLLIAEGAALGLAHGGDLAGRPRELFQAALKLAPDHARGLWFAGQAALQVDDVAEAQTYLEKLLHQDLPEDLRAEVVARMQELNVRSGRSDRIAGTAAAGSVAAIAAPETLQPAKPDAGGAGGPVLSVTIELSPSVRPQLSKYPTLFVFAKAAQGPPMPLAVQKLNPTQWPVKISLDDSMAMSPALRLSSFEKWIVTARLSASGTPQAQSGDWQGQVTVSREQAAQPIQIVISEQVP